MFMFRKCHDMPLNMPRKKDVFGQGHIHVV